MEARQVVEQARDCDFPQWQKLPQHIRPAFEKHCEDLINLAVSLDAAGRDTNVIRDLVSGLLKGYSAELIQALGDKS